MFTNSFIMALVAALPAAVNALGSAIVHNHCTSDVYLWSVENTGAGEMQTIAPGGTYSEVYRTPASGGISIKMSKSNDLWSGAPITQFEYTLAGNIWYDISNINGNPFKDGGIDLIPSDKSCPAKSCPGGLTTLCGDAYNIPTDDHATAACTAEADTIFSLCADSKTGSDSSDTAKAAVVEEAAAPAATTAAAVAAPATTAAPNVVAEVITADGHPDWVWTTFVTQVVTVYARDAAPIAEPTAAPVKRDGDHENMHKRAAHRHHFHRHGADVN